MDKEHRHPQALPFIQELNDRPPSGGGPKSINITIKKGGKKVLKKHCRACNEDIVRTYGKPYAYITHSFWENFSQKLNFTSNINIYFLSLYF